MNEYTITLRELNEGRNLPAHFPDNLMTKIRDCTKKDIPFSEFGFENLDELEFAYIYGMYSGIRDYEPNLRAGKWSDLQNALQVGGHAHEIDSWITELIQNAQDVLATKLWLNLKEEDGEVCLQFIHNSLQHFTHDQNSSLFRMYSTTKSIDPTSIGRFGIGFKYWTLFFKNIRVKSRKNEAVFEVVDHPQDERFEPEFSASSATGRNRQLTSFKFTHLTDHGKNSIETNGLQSFLQQKIPMSSPNLLNSNQDSFQLILKDERQEQNLENKLELSSTPINDITPSQLDTTINVQNIIVSQTNANGTQKKSVIKFELSLENLIQLDAEAGESFSLAKSEEYWNIVNANRGLDPDTTNQNEARERITQSITGDGPRLFAAITYDLELSEEGFFSQKFITPESRLNLPFIFDGPFQLNQNRESLNLTGANFGEMINRPLLKLFGVFYDAVVELIFQNYANEEINLNIKNLDQLANTKITAVNGHNILSESKVHNLLEETDWQKNGQDGCPSLLIELWRLLYQNPENDGALEWFLRALNPRLLRMSNNDITILISSEYEGNELPMDEPWFTQSFGEGIPERITTWINGEELGDYTWKDFVLTKFGNGEQYFSREVNSKYVFNEDNEELSEEENHFILTFSEFVENNETIEGEVYTCSNAKYPGYSKISNLIVTLFEMSRFQEQHQILADSNLLDMIKNFFEQNPENNSRYGNLALMKKNDDTVALVIHPNRNSAPCILVGTEGQYQMVSIERDTRNFVLSKVKFLNSPRILLWMNDDSPLWYVPRGTRLPIAQRKRIESHWQYRPIYLEHPNEWNWVELDPAFGENQHPVECYVIDVLAINPATPAAIKLQSGVFHSVRTVRGNLLNLPYAYRRPAERAIQPFSESGRNTPIRTLQSRVMCNQAELPRQVSYKIEDGNVIEFQGVNFASHAIVRLTGLFEYSCSNRIEPLNPTEIFYIISEKNRFITWGNQSRAYDVFWTKGEHLANPNSHNLPNGHSLNLRALVIHPNANISHRVLYADGEYVPRILSQIHGLSNQQLTPFWDSDSALHRIIRSSANGALQLPRTTSLATLEPDSQVVDDVHPILLPQGEEASELYRDFSSRFNPEIKIAISHLIQLAIGENENEHLPALDWLENKIENNCTFWLTLSLHQLNPQLEGGSYTRTLLRESGFADPESHPNLVEALAIGDNQQMTWRQLTQAIQSEANTEQLQNLYANAKVPILEVCADGSVQVNTENGPQISQLGDDHVVLTEWDEGMANLILIGDRIVCVPHWVSSDDRIIPLLRECGWIREGMMKSEINLFTSTERGTNNLDNLPENLQWINHIERSSEDFSIELYETNEVVEQPTNDFPIFNKRSVYLSIDDEDNQLSIHIPRELDQPYSVAELKLFWRNIKSAVNQLTHQRFNFDEMLAGLIGPWSNTDEFIETYCSYVGGLSDEIYSRLLSTDSQTLQQNIDFVSNQYNAGLKLADSKHDLLNDTGRYYGEIPSILTERFSESSSLCRTRSIWHWDILPEEDQIIMKNKLGQLPFDSMGQYLLLSPDEDARFGNSKHATTSYKFADDYLEKIYMALQETVGRDSSNRFITVEDLCFDTDQGSFYEMKFHKVHLMMIIGGLKAGGIQHAN